MIPFQVIDEKWMHPGHNAILVVKDGKVVKKFNNKEVYGHCKKHFELLKKYVPHASFNDEGLEIVMEKCVPLIEWLQDKNVQEKKLMAKQILNLIKCINYLKINHNDVHVNNLVVRLENTRDFVPLLIDFENASPIKNKVDWWDSNDCTGEKYMGFESDHYLSPKLILGFSAKELVPEILDKDLCDELIHNSKDSFGAKTGEGLYYGSYHHPKFHHTNSQRDTLDRFKFFEIEQSDIEGKCVLDIGCNNAAVSVMAATLGAHEVIGYDSEDRYINFSNKLFKYLGFNGGFELCDIKSLTSLPEHSEVIFALAMSAWVGKQHLIDLISGSDAELVYFEDNAPDKDTDLVIPNFNCDKKGVYDGRVSYVCRRKHESL